jgi:AraC-like DNA-binding protein
MRSKHVLPFAAVLKEHGEPVVPLIRRAGLPSACLEDPNLTVPAAPVGHFRELAARKTGCADLALLALGPLDIENLGDFGRAIMNAPTLYKTLTKVQQLAPTETSNLRIELRPDPHGAAISSQRVGSEASAGDWQNDLYVAALLLKVVRLADPRWSPSEISVAAPAGVMRSRAIESLGGSPRFGQASTGFVIPASMLALPVAKRPAAHGADVEARDLWSTAPPTTYAEAVQRIVRLYAKDRWLDIEDASAVADTSTRTMQRRLLEEKTSYSHILEATRAEIAADLLENTDATMSEIAHSLGYKHQAHFTRAFRRWSGMPPSEFRRGRRGDA